LSTNLITKALRLIFLRTGKYDYLDPAGWKPTRPAYEEQMKQLTVKLFGSPKGQQQRDSVALNAPSSH
jgi:hypothetical protein